MHFLESCSNYSVLKPQVPFHTDEMNPKFHPPLFILLTTLLCNVLSASSEASLPPQATRERPADNETIYKISKKLCWNCLAESIEFLFSHNLVRAAKWELPLIWDSQLQQYANSWAGQRQADCALKHSFPEGDFKLGENIFWGSGSTWTPTDAVKAWADEEKYYNYQANSCADGQMCGHYTQIVWKNTRRIGCARAICESGDLFMTCNYYPPGNYIGERPY
ncbi:pathogenesis-related protein PR-1-like [Coffea arabica]|uniref:Pathogenesis-related protein PR-1-like n=1 Tax=Coffea arabica TaxID=13443 RepID=A0ABM4UVP9_COFAR|nr:pathogenesis-related protein PR-1-like [Coffea arabica]